jgi:hypothetical protein
MIIKSPNGLHYPITIGELAKQRGDETKRSDPLFTYFYETTVEEGDKWGETKEVKKRFPVKFEALVDGAIKEWFVKQGSVVQRSGYVVLLCRVDIVLITRTESPSSRSKSHAPTRPSSAVSASIAAKT